MSTETVRQTRFTTGEVDVITWKRTENPEVYLSAAQSMLNMETGTTALARKRRGTVFVFDTTINSDPNAQLYEFLDNQGNYYILMSVNLAFNIFQIQLDGTIIQFPQVVTPYLSADLAAIDYTLDNDSIVLTHRNYPVARIYISSYSSTITFTYQVLQIFPLPAYDFGDVNYNQSTVTASGSGAVGSTFTITFNVAFGSNNGQEWVGGQIIAAGTSAQSPIGYIIINTASISAGNTTFTGTVRVAIGTPFSTNGDQYSVRKPAFIGGSDTYNRGYPAKVMFYQNRLWLAATPTLPTTLFGSQINQPINFDVGTGFDTDAIIYAIGQTNTGAILWINGGKQFEVYTENFEFVCPQEVNTGITPSTFAIRQQAAYGASTVLKPTTYINDSYYVSKMGNSIVNFHFDGVGLAYVAKNISAVSQHLIKNPVNRALQRGNSVNQDNFIYFLNSDSTLTSFQFVEEQGLAALTPIKFQTDSDGNPTVKILDIVSVNNVIYFLKYYTLTGAYLIERFDDIQKIDSSYTSIMVSDGLVTVPYQFEGYTVDIVFNNQDFGQYLVQNGSVQVFNPNGYFGLVQIGFIYPVQLIPMYIFAGNNATYYFKQLTKIYVDYYNSLNFYVNGNLVPFQNFLDIQQGLPLTLQTDTAIVDPVNGYDRFQTFTITQNSPFDLQILGIGYQIDGHII